MSLKRKSLAQEDNKDEDDDDDDDEDAEPNENNKPKSSINSRFSAPFTKTDLKNNKNKKLKGQKADHYDLASFRSQFRKPLVNTTNSNSSNCKSSVTASASGGATSSSAHVVFIFLILFYLQSLI